MLNGTEQGIQQGPLGGIAEGEGIKWEGLHLPLHPDRHIDALVKRGGTGQKNNRVWKLTEELKKDNTHSHEGFWWRKGRWFLFADWHERCAYQAIPAQHAAGGRLFSLIMC